jgi:hypothetical protein
MSALYPVANALRNPGQLIDNVYFSESSLMQTSARVLNKETYKYPFNSNALSTTNTLVIQKNIMATHVLCVFEFTPLATGSTIRNNPLIYLPAGWGFNLIRRIQIQYGGSDILEIDGKDNFMRAINECENDYKKTSMIDLAGKFVCNQGGTAGFVGLSSDGVIRGVVPLVLPHSSVNSFRQMPFDCSCLNQSINIRVTLNDAVNVWGFAGLGTEAIPAFSSDMLNLSNAQFVVGQSML